MRYRLLCLIVSVLAVAGCSHTMYLSDADRHGGTVNFVTTWSEDAAFEKAKAHCAQYHLEARRTMSVPGTATLQFLCEDPSRHPFTPPGGV